MVPPAIHSDFLQLVIRESWRTVAIATAGIALALLVALPATLVSVRVLSVSALSGRMSPAAFLLRQGVRWVLILLRSVPELIWALVFVRVVGLGPTAGVLAIALTYGGMLGKVYAEILESGDPAVAQTLLRNGSSRLQAFFMAYFRKMPQSSPPTRSIAGSVQFAHRSCWDLSVRADWDNSSTAQ